MKKNFSIALSIFLILIFSTMLILPVSAANTPSEKEEIVYALLNTDGSVKNIYIANIFEGGEITDYGDYSEIRNLTTSEKINKNGDKITINTSAGKFYYQGILERRELPWDINIKYFLDNQEVPGKNLAGKSGALKIQISVRASDNTANETVNRIFFNNYALQISLSLESSLCSNIKADNATIATAGSKKQLTYTVLPGKTADFSVSADVRDFEMEAITINAIRLNLNLDLDTSEFEQQLSDLANAIKELDDGALGLLDGVNRLSEGMEKYINGIKSLNDGLEKFSDSTNHLYEGASLLKNGLSELDDQKDSLLNGALAIQQATFDTVNAQLDGMGLGLPPLTPENYSTILSGLPGMASVKEQLDGIVQFTQGLKNYLDGVSQLDSGASDLLAGISDFKSYSSIIVASAKELYTAGSELNSAIKNLRNGLALYKDGTEKLKDGTSGIDSEIYDRIEEILATIGGKDDDLVSFVSDKNTNISAVQFAMKTDAITMPKIEKAEDPEPEKLNFWQRLLELFRSIFGGR